MDRLLAVAGLGIGIVGVVVAIVQGRRATRVRAITQHGLLEALSQMGSLVLTEDDVMNLSQYKGQPDATKLGRLTEQRRGIEDVYRRLVYQYLAGESTFSFDRLTAAGVDGLVANPVTVRIWRQAISQRDENQKLMKGQRRTRRTSRKREAQASGLPPRRSPRKVGGQ
jgi:hypothetical protein